MQSSLGRNPRNVQMPLDKAAMMTARCEMLLSPGTVISASIRGARFTRNSIELVSRHHSQEAAAACLSACLGSIEYKMGLSSCGVRFVEIVRAILRGQPVSVAPNYGNEKNFIRVRVFYFLYLARSHGHRPPLIRRKRTLDKRAAYPEPEFRKENPLSPL